LFAVVRHSNFRAEFSSEIYEKPFVAVTLLLFAARGFGKTAWSQMTILRVVFRYVCHSLGFYQIPNLHSVNNVFNYFSISVGSPDLIIFRKNLKNVFEAEVQILSLSAHGLYCVSNLTYVGR
jgi:hypothetical protein